MPTTRARVMLPKEELNSLGNFWQALGDKPRMELNYSVTLPIELEIAQAGKKSVKKTELEMKKRPRCKTKRLTTHNRLVKRDYFA